MGASHGLLRHVVSPRALNRSYGALSRLEIGVANTTTPFLHIFLRPEFVSTFSRPRSTYIHHEPPA